MAKSALKAIGIDLISPIRQQLSQRIKESQSLPQTILTVGFFRSSQPNGSLKKRNCGKLRRQFSLPQNQYLPPVRIFGESINFALGTETVPPRAAISISVLRWASYACLRRNSSSAWRFFKRSISASRSRSNCYIWAILEAESSAGFWALNFSRASFVLSTALRNSSRCLESSSDAF